MSKPSRILIVGPFPEPTTGVSLANKVVRSILDQAEGYKTSYINTSYSRFDENVGSFTIHKLLFNLAFYTKAWRVFQNDIIYITPGQSFLGVMKYAAFILLGTLSRKRIITHIHGNHLGKAYEGLKGLQKKVFYYLISKTTTGIVLSKSLTPNLEPFIPQNNIKALPNFAQDYVTHNAPVKDYTIPRIIYLSNLMQEKGIYDLLQALQMLESHGIAYEAKIAGAIDHTQKDSIEALINKLKNTQYVGIVKGDQKKDLLQWGTIFALPTYYAMEGQPISILEALATGNAILTTAHAGIPDIIEDQKHGRYVAKQNPQEIYDAVVYYAQNNKELEQISESNKLYFQQNFTTTQFGERLLDILQNP